MLSPLPETSETALDSEPEPRDVTRSFGPPHPPSTLPPRVCMLTHAFFPRTGGAESLLLSLLRPLSSRGVQVTVLTRRCGGMEPRSVVEGAQVVRAPEIGGRVGAALTFVLTSVAYILKNRRSFDIYHAHHLLSPTTAAVAARIVTGGRAVVTVHGLAADLAMLRSARFGTIRFWIFARLVDRFIAVSDEIAAELRAAGLPEEKVVRVQNGVDTDRCAPLSHEARNQRRMELGWEGHKVVLFVGRLEPVKNLHRLLDAWTEVRAALPEAHLVMCGTGSEESSLKNRNQAGVTFQGDVRNPLHYLQAADCFVLPSLSEGLSIALLEAMASGLPSVVSAVGGNTEVVREGHEGWVVPPGDTASLVGALRAALTSSRSSEFGGAARERVVARYSLAQTVDQLLALYESVLAPHGRARA